MWRPAVPGPETVVSARVTERILASIPDDTRRAYMRSWNDFTAWCARVGRTALPATTETVAEFMSVRADGGKAPPI
ncbi:hypothetical protein SAMN04489712_1344 [Thermomonospora echinospora]|uniref:Phage integrase, N-terminal SAM-like domain n=1 Tax=Thermomonospora echinospora TaxID=1992 RepID=A0A1H6E668_9ACTN|nr:hypothetical protein [Thermomonospora echinospora]SEG92466.1 hypothetical protein SAMN04489712_1344 [Thermomonospora echinospora]